MQNLNGKKNPMNWLKHRIPVYIALLPLAASLVILIAVIAGAWVWSTVKTPFESRPDLIYVGHLTDGCGGYAPPQRIVAIPVGFTVTPLDAAKRIPRCWRKLNTGVYADRENYYFYNTFIGFLPPLAEMKLASYAVSGTTGELLGAPVDHLTREQ